MNILNTHKITAKQHGEIIKAINQITTSLIILKTFCEKNKNYQKISSVNTLVDKISAEFEIIANKF